ncbi:hypothetical protein BAU08_23800 [Bordetella bronchialis]|uniref:Uncharacterized protein n=1 Tax=Bordetella bronchialis TaxID=463025 RepID=A0A193G3E0_9BORD|nr:hypothetical protein BAU08_23800 [Bordetella bronchialis]
MRLGVRVVLELTLGQRFQSTFRRTVTGTSIVGPVIAGDTIGADLGVVGICRTAKHNRAGVTSAVSVKNQHSVEVMRYIAVRLLAGKPAG